MDAIQIEHLSKQIPSGWPGRPPTTILSDVSLSVHKGEIYGFLGPNGAGKTTTLKIVMGLMRPTSGRVEILGTPAQDVRIHRRVGFLPESPYFYDYLTGEEFLRFYGRLAGLGRGDVERRVPDLLERVGLAEAKGRQLRKFSKGMLQRIGLAQAIIHDPEVVIMDEPMSGLDPIGRKEVRDLLLQLRDQGKTVFFSTHIITDVEMICDRVGILHKGKLMATGDIEDLVSDGETKTVEIVCEGKGIERVAPVKTYATRVLQRGDRCLIVVSGSDHLDGVLMAIRQHGGKLISVTPHKGSLEDVFLRQTGRVM
jgi:ABC-2 type transport system ATP-binding protein